MITSIVDFFISPAYAETAMGPAPASAANNLTLPIIMAVFIGFLYFTVWRPQNKRANETREMLKALSKGDEVVTAGGLIGKVSKISQSYIGLAVTDTVEVIVQKSAVVTVLPKGTMKSA